MHIAPCVRAYNDIYLALRATAASSSTTLHSTVCEVCLRRRKGAAFHEAPGHISSFMCHQATDFGTRASLQMAQLPAIAFRLFSHMTVLSGAKQSTLKACLSE